MESDIDDKKFQEYKINSLSCLSAPMKITYGGDTTGNKETTIKYIFVFTRNQLQRIICLTIAFKI